MNTNKTYDVIVIGAGSAGLTSAVGFVKIGKKVLLIEKEHMGGECTNSGCIPSKALLHHAKAYRQAKKIAHASLSLEEYRNEAFAYVRGKIDTLLSQEQPKDFEDMGIDVVMGEAVFESSTTLRVDKITYSFDTAIIATGSSPRMVGIPGLSKDDILTNQNIFTLTNLPKRLCILGAGPISMELGQAFAMLGSKVTIIAREDRFASLEDEKISPIIQKEFEALGIDILLNATITEVRENEALVSVKKTDKKEYDVRVPFDKFLVAIGRVPNLPQGLDDAKIKYNEHAIITGSQHRTSNKNVYAVGDVALRLKFTHTADDAARQVVTRIASHKFLRVNNKKSVPKVTYTSPEIAAVGLSHEQASKKYSEKEIYRLDVSYSSSDRAKTDSATDGLMVVIVRRLTGTVLGANIIGTGAGEMISIFTLAIDQKISMWKLRTTIYAYPTYSLLVRRAGDMFFAMTLSTLKSDLFYFFKKHILKLVALAFWVTLLYFFHRYRIQNNLSYQDMLITIFELVTTSAWGPLAFMIVYLIRPLIFFPATLLTILAGILFGLPLGIAYTIIGENMSANFAYGIGRFFGSDLKLEDSFMGRWIEALRRRPFISVLFMRLFYVPFDLTNYGSGILKVRWPSYALATVIGILPGLTTFVALGAGIEDISTFELSAESFNFTNLGIAVTIFTVSLLLSRYLHRWHANKNNINT